VEEMENATILFLLRLFSKASSKATRSKATSNRSCAKLRFKRVKSDNSYPPKKRDNPDKKKTLIASKAKTPTTKKTNQLAQHTSSVCCTCSVEEMENATITQFCFDFETGPIIMPELFRLKAPAHMRTLNLARFVLMSLYSGGAGEMKLAKLWFC